MKRSATTAALAATLLAACSSGSDTPTGPGGYVLIAPTAVETCDPLPIDDYDLGSVSVNGDDLSVAVSFAGGCGTHEFRLCWDGLHSSTLPPEVTLGLVHDVVGADDCEALIGEVMAIDLTPIRAQGSNRVVVNVGAQQLDYLY